MSGSEYYLVVLLVYAGIDIIAVWGLNLEFGVAGVANFAYIAILAVGAYTYGVLTLGPDTDNGGFQTYIIGANLAPGVAMVIAALVGGAAGGLAGLVGSRRLRPDYQAVALLVISVIFTTVVQSSVSLFNGNPGISLVPNPIGPSGTTGGNWGFFLLVAGCCAVSYLVLRRFTDGQMGRTLRAVRDDSDAATAIGKNVVGLRLMVQVVGGMLAGLAGALFVAFIGAWSPAGWQYVETLVLLTAIIVGGAGNNFGVVLGAVLVPVGLQQASNYIPTIASRPDLALDLGWFLAGAISIAFIWVRPRGLVPERRPKIDRAVVAVATSSSIVSAGRARVWERFANLVPQWGNARAASPASDAVMPTNELISGQHKLSQSDGPALQTDSLTVEYSGVRAVDAVSLSIPSGMVWGLIGPNGAGKSSLLGAIAGFVPMQGGRVLLQGSDVTAMSPHRKVHAGLTRTFQLPHEFGRLTTIENLLAASPDQVGERVRGVLLGGRSWRPSERRETEQAWRLLEMFRLDGKANTLAGTLSGGERRLVEIARAVMTRPAVLMLDEPAAGLSPAILPMLQNGLRSLASVGITIVVVEHNLAFAREICDRVVAMARGAVVSIGSMDELRSRRDVQEAYVNG